MICRRTKLATSVLLSAFLVAAAVAPPAMRHVHQVSGEVVKHDHKHAVGHCHSAAVDHDHGGDREHQHTSSAAGLSDLRHLHVALLGIEFSLPDPMPADENQTGESDFELISLRPSQDLPLMSAGWHQSSAKLAMSAVLSEAVESAQCSMVAVAPPPVESAPLCDRARHERSGVLLA